MDHSQLTEGHYVVMLGTLHRVHTDVSKIGDWLKDSGWAMMLVEAGVIT